MNDADKFIQEEFLPFYKQLLNTIRKKYHILAFILSGKKNHIGIRLTENGSVIGQYTIYLDGLDLSNIDNGILSSEVHTPFGIIRPYNTVEKSTLGKMIRDEPNFMKEPIGTMMKHVHGFTIKFL